MRSKMFIILLSLFIFYGCGRPTSKDMSPIIAKVDVCEISAQELQEGFATSAFSARPDKIQARRDYLEMLIDQKLILLDAQKRGLDKAPDFLKSVEKFWAQSLVNVSLGQKTMELHRGSMVRDEDVRRIYETMVREGVTSKSFEDVYPQIKWQAQKQMESQRLQEWMEGIRKNMAVTVNEDALKALK